MADLEPIEFCKGASKQENLRLAIDLIATKRVNLEACVFLQSPEATLEMFQSTREQIIRAGNSIVHEATKVSLGYKDITDLESFSSLLKDFVIPIDALAMFTMSATLYCSKTTGKQVIDLVCEVLRKCVVLLEHFIETHLENESKHASLCGEVMEACKNLSKIPKSNKIALSKKLLDCYKEVKDITEEFEEMLNRASHEDLKEENQEDWTTGISSLDNYTTDEMSSQDVRALSTNLEVFKSVNEFLKKLSSVVMHMKNEVIVEHILEFLESLVDYTTQLSKSTIEFGFCLYPPVDKQEALLALTEYSLSIQNMMECCDRFSQPDMDNCFISKPPNIIDAEKLSQWVTSSKAMLNDQIQRTIDVFNALEDLAIETED